MLTQGKKKILQLFFNNPQKWVHLRNIAGQAKVSLDTAHKYLHEFTRQGWLLKREETKMTFFRANLRNDYLRKIFETFEIERRDKACKKNKIVSHIKKELEDRNKLASVCDLLALFGSVARGKFSSRSDIDILCVCTSSQKRKAQTKLDNLKEELSYLGTINPVVLTKDKFSQGIKEETSFFREFWKDRVVLLGENYFWKTKEEVTKHEEE